MSHDESDPLEAAIALHTAGRTAEADARYRAILAADPDNARAAHPLGVLLLAEGRIDEAIEFLARAVRATPRWAEAQNNYGVALREAGRLHEAVAAFRAAAAARPTMFDAHNNLAEAHLELDAIHEAFDAANEAHRIDPSRAGPLFTQGMVHLHLRQHADAIEKLRAGLEREPGNPAAEELLRIACSRVVEPWHFAMMNERTRNEAYDAAIRRAVKPGVLVFDLGAGSGLLSMMAARAGAGRVVACEMNPATAAKAREIVAHNGYADRVTIHALPSDRMRLGAELPDRADVLVSEVLDSNVLGEGVLPAFEDAHARLLKPGATVIPRAATAMIALAGGPELARTMRVGDAVGFDLSPFNEFTPERVVLDGTGIEFERYSDAVAAVRFDFRETHYPSSERVIEVPVTASGECLGVIQWLRIEVDDEASYENRPERWEDNPGNWLHSFFPFHRSVRVEAGRTLRIVAGHGTQSLFFRVSAR